ncbi:hypothetical protein N7456_004411 [Penicillium angulare]|uniref:Uncharacterized protein n=1 Tax=Penicillium angulare TaxID=116970 RepID=A0A9W9FWH9_9EURO|nr:hypothetical protein N7456_004411 [Penicillium angulare]
MQLAANARNNVLSVQAALTVIDNTVITFLGIDYYLWLSTAKLMGTGVTILQLFQQVGGVGNFHCPPKLKLIHDNPT